MTGQGLTGKLKVISLVVGLGLITACHPVPLVESPQKFDFDKRIEYKSYTEGTAKLDYQK